MTDCTLLEVLVAQRGASRARRILDLALYHSLDLQPARVVEIATKHRFQPGQRLFAVQETLAQFKRHLNDVFASKLPPTLNVLVHVLFIEKKQLVQILDRLQLNKLVNICDWELRWLSRNSVPGVMPAHSPLALIVVF